MNLNEVINCAKNKEENYSFSEEDCLIIEEANEIQILMEAIQDVDDATEYQFTQT